MKLIWVSLADQNTNIKARPLRKSAIQRSMLIFITITALLNLAQFAQAWGADTHPTIGYLAERFLLDETVPSVPKNSDLLLESSYYRALGC
jgi:hypothetical protein